MFFAYIALGLVTGVLSGIVGIGGGVLIVPVLVFLFGFAQKTAQGTTLALLLPPIGLLAAWTYFQRGFVNVPAAICIAGGFIIGGLIGSRFAVGLSNEVLTRIFGGVLLMIAISMIIGKK